MRHGLAGMTTGIEDHTVPGIGYAFSHRHLVRLLRDLGEQAGIGGDGGKVGVMIPRDYQHMNGSLRIYVAECKRAGTIEYQRGRHLAGRDSAE
jgi:hypothetical protein